MNQSMTHKYIPRLEQREPNLFIEEYYSSTDTKIFIDDMEQTEISYISYSLQEQLKPIYGYASNTFDDVAIGNRIVIGTIKVPIKNPEAQSSKEDIMNNSLDNDQNENDDELEDYNSQEQEKTDNKEWIGNSSNNPFEDSEPEYDEEKIYQQFVYLEYINENDNFDKNKLKDIIKQFQIDNNIEPTGILTKETEELLQELVDKKIDASKFINIPPGYKLYMSPNVFSQSITSSTIYQAYIVDTSINGWLQVQVNVLDAGSSNESSIFNSKWWIKDDIIN